MEATFVRNFVSIYFFSSGSCRLILLGGVFSDIKAYLCSKICLRSFCLLRLYWLDRVHFYLALNIKSCIIVIIFQFHIVIDFRSIHTDWKSAYVSDWQYFLLILRSFQCFLLEIKKKRIHSSVLSRHEIIGKRKPNTTTNGANTHTKQRHPGVADATEAYPRWRGPWMSFSRKS